MKLSDNFTLSEMISSRTAHEQNIHEQFGPPKEVQDNLKLLCDKVLQPLRIEYGLPITVNSGYRCPRLNDAVKGSNNSDHLRGMAADITGKDVKMLYDLAIALNLPFRQLIYYKSRNFVHISYNKYDIKKQAWINE